MRQWNVQELESLKNKSIYTPKNHREWFWHYLFNDVDFVREKDRINRAIDSMAPRDSQHSLVAGWEKHKIFEQLDKQVDNAKIDPQAKQIIQDIQALAVRFRVPVSVVKQGLDYYKVLPQYTLGALPSVGIENNKVVIRLDGTMKLADIKSVYPQIQELQKGLPDYQRRNRSKVRPDLIYAIYKQRLSGKTFKEIYTLYETSMLPGYTGDKSIVGEEAFARMYRKFKPDS